MFALRSSPSLATRPSARVGGLARVAAPRRAARAAPRVVAALATDDTPTVVQVSLCVPYISVAEASEREWGARGGARAPLGRSTHGNRARGRVARSRAPVLRACLRLRRGVPPNLSFPHSPPLPSPHPTPQFAEKIGLPVTESRNRLFGFHPFSELWTGRLAMIGFLCAIIGEASGHGGALAQLGFDVPSTPLTASMAIIFGGVTAVASAQTLAAAATGTMSPDDVKRYGAFLGMRAERDADAVATAMKAAGDFTTPGDSAAAIAAARGATPADAILAPNNDAAEAAAATTLRADGTPALALGADVAAVAAEAARVKRADFNAPALSLAGRDDAVEALNSAGALARQLKAAELENGRWAMVGFLAAILVESATGQGILGQLIFWLKAVGLLGAASGF